MPKTKRNHYIPKAYLRHFASPNDPEKVYMFDKQSNNWILTNVLNAGAWSDFYSDEDEKWLSDKIEFPAGTALARLRASQPISTNERHQIALYLESMIKRVPSTRRKFLERAPEKLEELKMDAEQLASELGATPRVVAEGLGRLENELSNPIPMTSKIAQYQWTSQEFIDALLGMDWTVLIARGLERFVTGDNPGYFDWHYGLIKPESELASPLSPSTVLHMGRRKLKDGSIDHIDATSAQVKEINRRMILGSERFIFSHQEHPWVKDVLRNPVRQWKRILN